MIPKNNDTIEIIKYPSYTYELNYRNGTITRKIDSLKAIEQAVYKILSTGRYENIIYSWDYGNELNKILGKPISYVIPEVERYIVEALKQDDRIQKVDNFSFYTIEKEKLLVKFQVVSDFGESEISFSFNEKGEE